MGRGNSGLRGSRLGGTSYEVARGPLAPRQERTYFCSRGHESNPTFAVDAEIPDTWACTTCGDPAGLDKENPPEAPVRTPVAKTPMEYLRMRRTDEEGAVLLEEALAALRAREGRK